MASVSNITIHKVAVLTAAVAAGFLAVVASALVYLYATATTNDPWKSPQLLGLKERLRASPKDEAVKKSIRELDLKFRQNYARRIWLDRSGGWLLLGSGAILVIALQTAAEMRRRQPLPKLDHEAAARLARQASRSRRAVALAGLASGAAMASLAVTVPSALSEKLAAEAKLAQAAGASGGQGGGQGAGPGGASTAGGAGPSAQTLPSAEEFAKQWPRFRGPDGSGASPVDGPITWDGEAGKGIAWKAAVPSPGFNSPIAWGDRVFVSGSTKEKREVFCFDAASGKLLWQCEVGPAKGAPKEGPELNEQTGYAASTMATDGLRVYAIFGHGDIAAVSFDGKLVWNRHLGVPKNPYGHATSLAVWEGRVIVQLDQGESSPAGSKLISIDGATGRTVWEKPRAVSASWATPIVVQAAGRAQIVTLAVPHVISYAVADGAELWRSEGMEGEVTPSPIFAGGLVLAVSPSHEMLAIRPDGSGDVTATHVAWKADEGMPDVTSPVGNSEFALVVNSGGLIVCYDVKDGKKVWDKDLETEVQASPAIFGRRLYVSCVNGTTFVAELGRECRELARNPLGEKIYASPALAGGRLFLRGLDHLYCIEAKEAKP